jgi:hypothetical protein
MATTLRTAGGDMVLPRVIVTDFASCVQQSVIDGLNLWLGEWFLNTAVGFPWGQSVLGVKLVNTNQINALLRQFLLSVQGIVSVTATSSFNRLARQFSYSFWAQLNNGQILTGGSGTPVVISGSPS